MTRKVLKFSASWCSPCKSLSRTIDSMKDAGTFPSEIELVEIDVDTEPDLCLAYGIRSVPTLVMVDVDTGSVIRSRTGDVPAAVLSDWLLR